MNYFLKISLILISSIAYPQIEKPIIVAELFTSQGCHSCPPADRLLSEMVDSDRNDVEIMALSFHVDYWNYIGWKDPYSSHEFSDRQRKYAQKFNSNQVYTPQIIVNGKHEFVGSNRLEWIDVVNEEKQIVYQKVKLEQVELESNHLTFSIQLKDKMARIVNVAIVERGLIQKVLRGENKGKVLQNDNVVRHFEQRLVSGKSQFELHLPTELNSDNSSLIVYSQETNNWVLTGAVKLDLNKI